MRQDSGVAMSQLRVDGGMTKNNLLMQLQADLLNISVGTPCLPHPVSSPPCLSLPWGILVSLFCSFVLVAKTKLKK